jgi:hypothetical protein
MIEIIEEIIEIVNRETKAWNEKDLNLLLGIFHPDMVWVWPKTADSHDPADWETFMGRFDETRWGEVYSKMFSEYNLVHNNRSIVRVELTKEQDGAFAVVDIDTLWKSKKDKTAMHWLGRTCKTYVKTPGGWKMIAQTGTLKYK